MRLLVVLAVILSLVGLLLLMIAFQCVASKNTKRVIRNSSARAFADPHLIVSKILISARRA
jgi:uncharacterized membrane protein